MKRRATAEDGASLILVMLFVVVFGVVIGAVLGLASAGLNTTSAYVDVRDEQHAVDGAVEGAINAIRYSSSAGLQGEPCPAFAYEPGEGTSTVTVNCWGIGGTAGGGVDDTMPEYAVLTLGRAPADGFIHSGSASKLLTVNGGVFSNSVIVLQGRMNVFGDATALGVCDEERLFATGSKQCDLGPDHAGESDPGYPHAAPDVALMEADPLATCGPPPPGNQKSSRVVRFEPGLYTEDPSLSVPAHCTGSVWWLSPGAYYFDLPEGRTAWDLPDHVQLVGGTPAGWSESSPSSAVTLPGACDATAAAGVQLLFGGQTRLVTSGPKEKVELCAGAAPSTKQRIAVYGVPSGERMSPVDSPSLTGTATSATFAPADAAEQQDGVVAVAALSSAGTKVAELSMSDFSDGLAASAVPAGSRILSARAYVAHAEESPRIVPHFDVYGTGGTHLRRCSWSSTSSLTLREDVCDFTGDLAAMFSYRAINDLVVKYTADGSTLGCTGQGQGSCRDLEVGTALLDVIRLEVQYVPPSFVAHDCPSCPILDIGNNGFAIFHGTVYAPTASVVAKVHNGEPGDGEVVFGRGIVARMVDADAISSSRQVSAPFQLPGVDRQRVVLFEASLPGDDVRLRAKVRYIDTLGDSALPGHEARVQNWAVIR